MPGELNDVVAELAAASSRLGGSVNATTAASLADLVRIMNTYYSNLRALATCAWIARAR